MRARRELREMSIPAAIAYVLFRVLSLVFRIVAVLGGLVAEISERVADAGDVACAAARGPVVVASTRPRSTRPSTRPTAAAA